MVVERLDCGTGDYVRVLVNDQVQPLEFCGGENKEGICELGAFVDSQKYARENGQGDWEACIDK